MKRFALILLIGIAAAATSKQENNKSSGTGSIFKTFLQRAEVCSVPAADAWLKQKLQGLLSKQEPVSVDGKEIQFPPSPILSGNVALKDLRLNGIDTIVVNTAAINFEKRKVTLKIDIEQMDLELNGKYETHLTYFEDGNLDQDGDIDVKFKFSNWKSSFDMTYAMYPLDMSIVASELLFDEPVVDVHLDNFVDNDCLDGIINEEVSVSLTDFLQDEKQIFIDEINKELKVIVDRIINSLLPSQKPEVPIPGPPEVINPDLVNKGTLSHLISMKVNEEFSKLVNGSGAKVPRNNS